MIHGLHDSKRLGMIARSASTFRVNDWMARQIDPDVARHVARVSVWGRWFVLLVVVFEFVYRPGFWYSEGHFEYTLLLAPLLAFNGLAHYRLRAKGWVPWHWLLLLSAMDIAMATAGILIQGGFGKGFIFVAYYPALALFIVVFTSLWLGLAWTTMTAGVYALVCLRVGSGLDFAAGHEKELLVRVAAMYTLVLVVGFVARFERSMRQAAVDRERTLYREQIEFSQAVHDTAAQSAYMIGLGIDTAKEQVKEGSPGVAATLEAIARLARSTIWELRYPINIGGIYEGHELSWALRAHAGSFTNVTSVRADMAQTGDEPPLSIEARSLLFSIAHNALTNAYRHAEASRVRVHLDFGNEDIWLSVSDDGIGLPDDYAERGRGFANMSSDAERLGGSLIVEERGPMGGATIACVMPAKPQRG